MGNLKNSMLIFFLLPLAFCAPLEDNEREVTQIRNVSSNNTRGRSLSFPLAVNPSYPSIVVVPEQSSRALGEASEDYAQPEEGADLEGAEFVFRPLFRYRQKVAQRRQGHVHQENCHQDTNRRRISTQTHGYNYNYPNYYSQRY